MPAAPALPALVSDNVATQTGGMVEVGLAGQRLQVEPVAVASQFPGVVPNAPFVVVPVRGLLERQFSIPEAGVTLNEVWANTPEDPSPLLAEAGWVPGVVNATAPIEGLLAQLPQSLAVGMNFAAAVAGVGLVIIGVAAGLYFTMRRRDYEFAALRAMGTGRRQIRTTLVLEQAALLGFALLAGLGDRLLAPSARDALRRHEPRGLVPGARPGARLARDRRGDRGDRRRERDRARRGDAHPDAIVGDGRVAR